MSRYYEGSGSGRDYDRYADRFDDSPMSRVRQHYWTAKQAIQSKFGKKEDEHLVASDAELDAKLAVFYSVKSTCESMLQCIESYQDYICELTMEENALGRFLKQRGKQDTTQAGKMMSAVGRAQSFTAQQRLALRVPLVRLYQELDVFTERAVEDCNRTVDATRKARTEYRGSLLWMKNVSEQLDPDTYRQLEKFRAVQAAVRRNKAKFDKLKLDCLQKVDLLAASRCNLFSQLMANYQNCLLSFWDRTSKAHHTVSENFKGYQHYEFIVLKDLSAPSKRLAELTAGENENETNQTASGGGEPAADQSADAELIALEDADDTALAKANDAKMQRSDSLERMLFGQESPEHKALDQGHHRQLARDRSESPLGIDDDRPPADDLLQGPHIPPPPEKLFASDAPVPRLPPPPGWSSAPSAQPTSSAIPSDLFSDQFALMGLSAESTNDPIAQFLGTNMGNDSNSFTYQWQRAFGGEQPQSHAPLTATSSGGGVDASIPSQQGSLQPTPLQLTKPAQSFLPSELFERSIADAFGGPSSSQHPLPQQPLGSQQKDHATWYGLFADLDPLKGSEQLDAAANRQC